jgi:transcription antitermination factor NusG
MPLSSPALPAEPATSAWNAVAVRTTAEKATAQALAKRGVEVFSPCYTTQRLWSGRALDIEVPLFPGYVFCCLPSSYPRSLLTVEGVLGSNGSSRKSPIRVDNRELRSIRLLTSLGLPLTPWPYLSQTSDVEIVEGRLSGVSGVRIAPGKLVVSLTVLQRSILVDLKEETSFRLAAAASIR